MSKIMNRMITFSNKREKIIWKTSNRLKEFNQTLLINWEEKWN